MNSANPRLDHLRGEVERTVLDPFRLHGWSAEIVREVDREDCIEIAARRRAVTTRIAVLYSSSGISNARYQELSNEVDRIFFCGQPYMLDSFARGVTVPVEPLQDFFPFLVDLNRQVDPDCSPPVVPRRPPSVLWLTAENPLDAVIARLQQFTSRTLARKLVERRAETEAIPLQTEVIGSKAIGIAYSMRGALDYVVSTPRDALNKRVLGLYYGTMALAQAEMLASPSGPTNLDQVEGMTRYGHGLYVLPTPQGGFADLHVGVLTGGFFPKWMKFLGHDTSGYPQLEREVAPGVSHRPPVHSLGKLAARDAEMLEATHLLGLGGQPGHLRVLQHVVQREQATDQDLRRGDPPVADVLSAQRPVETPAEDPAHLSAFDGVLGDRPLPDQGTDEAQRPPAVDLKVKAKLRSGEHVRVQAHQGDPLGFPARPAERLQGFLPDSQMSDHDALFVIKSRIESRNPLSSSRSLHDGIPGPPTADSLERPFASSKPSAPPSLASYCHRLSLIALIASDSG